MSAEKQTSHAQFKEGLHGIACDFDDPERLLDACRTLKAGGWEDIEVYTPYSLAEIPSILGWKKSPMSLIVGTCGFLGAIGGFAMQTFANVVHYPWNIGGKPPFTWPMWIPITFECGILGAGVSGVIAMLFLNRLPHLHHPMLRLPEFARASKDRFFLVIEATDPKFDKAAVTAALETTGPLTILEVPR